MDNENLRTAEGPAEDSFLAALEAAELDDEPLTAEDIAAMEEGEAAFRRGEYVTLEALRSRLLGEDATASSETR